MSHDETRYDEDAEVRRIRREVRGFKQHALTYLCVNGFLFLISILGGHFWFVWPAAAWGVGLVLHAMSVFGADVGREWEERMVDHIVERRRQTAQEGTPRRPEPPRPAPQPPSAQPPSQPTAATPPRPDSDGTPPPAA